MIESRDTCLVSRRGILCLGLGTCVFHLGSCLEFPCLVIPVSRDCVLTMSLSGIAKCLFCAETLAFLAECRPLGPFTHYLLTYCKTIDLAVVVLSWL